MVYTSIENCFFNTDVNLIYSHFISCDWIKPDFHTIITVKMVTSAVKFKCILKSNLRCVLGY